MAFRVLNTWQGYHLMCMKGATPAELEKAKEAFFAGAATVFQGMMASMSDGDEPTEADMQFMAELQAELDAFGLDLDMKHLGRILRGFASAPRG